MQSKLISVLAWLQLALGVSLTATGQQTSHPFLNLREQGAKAALPASESVDPATVAEIGIGYFGPADSDHRWAGDMWTAADMAIEQANAQGGLLGRPVRLIPAWSEDPWGTGVRKLTQLVYSDRVWALIGGVDGPTTHLAEQVVAKARLALISPVSTDKSVNLANVPWMFSIAPGDHLLTPILAEAIAFEKGEGSLLRIATNDHDSQHFVRDLEKQLSLRNITPQFQFDVRPGKDNVAAVAREVHSIQPQVIVLSAPSRDAAWFVAGLRDTGYSGPLFGGPSLGRTDFLQHAAGHAEGVVFPLLCDQRMASEGFTQAFTDRRGYPPDDAARCTFDAVKMTIAAIERAGLNRSQIRAELAQMVPWTGAGGEICWDRLGSNTRRARLGTIIDGRVAELPTAGDRTASPARSAVP
jgi:ABC-type branched-subunit amino acid transport system substrate-binding protein